SSRRRRWCGPSRRSFRIASRASVIWCRPCACACRPKEPRRRERAYASPFDSARRVRVDLGQSRFVHSRAPRTMARNASEITKSAVLLDPGRVLITGGAGMIGSALAWELNRRGCDSIIIADFLRSSEKWRNLSPLRFEDYVEADDLLPLLEEGVLGQFDLILHMGACSSTTERDASYLIR